MTVAPSALQPNHLLCLTDRHHLRPLFPVIDNIITDFFAAAIHTNITSIKESTCITPSSDDGLRVPEELVPPIDKKYGSRIVAAIKEAMADPVRRAQIEKNAAEAKEETNQEIDAEALAMQQSSLTCIQCRLDGTVPFKTQNLVYTHSQLNNHLKSNFHARREQVRRAFNIDKNSKGQCECPRCPAGDGGKMYLQKAFLAHMESERGASMDF